MKQYDVFVVVDYYDVCYGQPMSGTDILGVFSSKEKAFDAIKNFDPAGYISPNKPVAGDSGFYYDGPYCGRDFWQADEVEHRLRVVAFEMDKELE